jgi:hypothetical protein
MTSTLVPRRAAHRRPTTASAVLALAVAALAAPPARAFDVLRHSNMTGEVLARQGVGGRSLSFIKQGVRWPDLTQCLSGCYCPAFLQIFCSDPDSNEVRQFSVSHFDNNMIPESMANVELLMTLARSGLNRGAPPATDAERRSVGVALMFFGEALHAIQDFYAHSTWVEMNRDLVRIGGRIESCPMWNGEGTGASGTTVVGGVTVVGTQTGFVDLPVPAGSVTHSALNKDNPNTTQGQIAVNRIFPFGLIGTYYEIASGQEGSSGGSYKDTGLAPRHTIKAWQCLLSECAIYNLPPSPSAAAGPARTAAALDIPSLLAWIESDPGMAAAAARIDSLWESSDPDTPSTFPREQFDAEGWPLPVNVSARDFVRPEARVLDRAWPNPFHGRIAIRFYAPEAGPVRLDVFDAAGRRVHTLLDRVVEPGWKDVLWSGHDGAGTALPSGAYMCRLSGFGRSESCVLSLVR